MARAIPRYRLLQGNGCSRGRLNRNSSSGSPKVGTTISTHMVQRQRCGNSSAPREADSCQLLLTFILSMLTFGTGRTNILFGLVHVVVFAVFVFLVFVP